MEELRRALSSASRTSNVTATPTVFRPQGQPYVSPYASLQNFPGSVLAGRPRPRPEGQNEQPQAIGAAQLAGASRLAVIQEEGQAVSQPSQTQPGGQKQTEGSDTDTDTDADSDVDVDVDDVPDHAHIDDGDDELLAVQTKLSTFHGSMERFLDIEAKRTKKGRLSMRSLMRDESDEPSPKRKRVVQKRGPRKAAKPAGDVMMRINAAQAAFTDQRIEEAFELVSDAIRLNAETANAWSLMASILDEMGDARGSLGAAFAAAHLRPKEIEMWDGVFNTAVDIMEDDAEEDTDDVSQIALAAISQAIRIKPDDIARREARAEIYLGRRSYRAAINEYLVVLEHSPIALDAARGLAEASAQIKLHRQEKQTYGKTPEAVKDAFQRCIEHYQAQPLCPDFAFAFSDILIYVEALENLGEHDAALREIRSLSRWLLGRREEIFWDDHEDDREWDKNEDRRAEVAEFVSGKFPNSAYGEGLPYKIRAKLAIFRLRLNHTEEAERHLEHLAPSKADTADESGGYEDNDAIFLELATALYESGRRLEALEFYETLREEESEELDATALYNAGKCYLESDDKRHAEQCFTAALDTSERVEACIEARYELAKMYEAAKQEREAYLLVAQAIDLGKRRDISDSMWGFGMDGSEFTLRPKARRKYTRKNPSDRPKRPKEKKPKAPKAKPNINRTLFFALDEEKARAEQARSAELAEKWRVIREMGVQKSTGFPKESWMEAAKELVDDFRSFKAFYPWQRYLIHLGVKKDHFNSSSANPTLLKMAERLRDNLDTEEEPSRGTRSQMVGYRDVSFEEWLELFVRYALGLAHLDKIQESYLVCEAAKNANVFSENAQDMLLIHVTMAACALRGRDEAKCVEVARYFMAKVPFSSDAFRVYAALCRLCAGTGAWYSNSKVQKFILRQIKHMDAALLPAEEKLNILHHLDAKMYPGKELDAQLLMLYGHILLVSNSFSFALNYYMRALAVDPDNTMINVSIGLAFVQDALKRQSENRQHMIAQGFAFLHKYYTAVLETATSCMQRQEAHFNMARSYHSLGLTHLAIKYYKYIFQEVAAEGETNLYKEAAYNVQLCCIASGDLETARAVGDQWLVL